MCRGGPAKASPDGDRDASGASVVGQEPWQQADNRCKSLLLLQVVVTSVVWFLGCAVAVVAELLTDFDFVGAACLGRAPRSEPMERGRLLSGICTGV